MGLGRPSNFRQAVLEADKLLDFVLRKMNYEGETIADRIRSSKDCYKDYQGLWDAHKVRNRLVHESQSEVMHHSAKEAIEKFEKALRDLRVL
ncbi:MAG: hypothetical protein NT135_01130 [Candidatus Berkelbacteria bacterium]|nr:hypothetical protein [Candidatus Berkelbacteria bacterium]